MHIFFVSSFCTLPSALQYRREIRDHTWQRKWQISKQQSLTELLIFSLLSHILSTQQIHYETQWKTALKTHWIMETTTTRTNIYFASASIASTSMSSVATENTPFCLKNRQALSTRGHCIIVSPKYTKLWTSNSHKKLGVLDLPVCQRPLQLVHVNSVTILQFVNLFTVLLLDLDFGQTEQLHICNWTLTTNYCSHKICSLMSSCLEILKLE